MDVIYNFKVSEKEFPIHFWSSEDGFYFQANEIEKALEMGNIRSAIQKFSETQKVTRRISLATGAQYMVCLSEDGINHLLDTTRKPNAKILKEWITKKIQNIRVPEKRTIESEKVFIESEKKPVEPEKNIVESFLTNVETSIQEFEESDDSESLNDGHYFIKKTRGRGPKIQQYDPETFELIKTYDTVVDIVREMKDLSASAIRSATKVNNVYRGYRWFSIDRSAEEKKYDIPATVKVLEQRKELVAELNLDKNKIVNVYASQKDAGIAMHMKSAVPISTAIKQQTLSAHRYWKYFDDCSEEMKEEYLKDHTLPEQEKPKGVGIEMIDPKTKQVVETFSTIAELIKKHPMGRTTLKNAIANKHTHLGYLWRYAEM